MPVHNEEAMLPLSLPSILNLDPRPSEVVCVFDRCSDRSHEIAHGILGGLLHSLEVDRLSGWSRHAAYVRRLGFHHAGENVILNTDADIILDPAVTKYLPEVGQNHLAMISFQRVNYPLGWRHYWTTVLQQVFRRSFRGQYLLHRPAWLHAEDQEQLKKMRWGEDSFLRINLMSKGFGYKFAWDTRNIHLREREVMQTWILHGMAWKQLGIPLRKAVSYSFLHVKPGILVGWLMQK